LLQVGQRLQQGRRRRQHLDGLIEHRRIAVKLHQGQQAFTRGNRKVARQRAQLAGILGRQSRMHARQYRAVDRHAGKQ